MGAPGWTSFCRNGHIVEVCGHHQIIFDDKRVCDICGADVIGSCIEWGDSDYGPHEVPYTPSRQEPMKITREYKGHIKELAAKVDIYDVSKLLARRAGLRKEFTSEGVAMAWMVEEVNDSCMDNSRFAFEDDEEAMRNYEEQKNSGCCGSFDEDIIVAGRPAKIGCNYGH